MKSTRSAQDRFRGLLPSGFLVRALLYGMLWMALTGGQRESWLIGVPAVLLAVCIADRSPMFRTGRLSLSGGVRFAGFFVKASLVSGIDVVQRALRRRLVLEPDFIEYRLSLVTEAARVFMADVVSLLPGTLSADLVEERLTVHVLDRSAPVLADLKALEMRVAAMLEADGPPPGSQEGGR